MVTLKLANKVERPELLSAGFYIVVDRSTSVGSSLNPAERLSRYDKSTAISTRTSTQDGAGGVDSGALSAAAKSSLGTQSTQSAKSSAVSVPTAGYGRVRHESKYRPQELKSVEFVV